MKQIPLCNKCANAVMDADNLDPAVMHFIGCKASEHIHNYFDAKGNCPLLKTEKKFDVTEFIRDVKKMPLDRDVKKMPLDRDVKKMPLDDALDAKKLCPLLKTEKKFDVTKFCEETRQMDVFDALDAIFLATIDKKLSLTLFRTLMLRYIKTPR